MKKKTARQGRQRGSILLLVVITMTILSMFAVATAENSESMMTIASSDREAVRARLAADSALSYTQRQLALDPDWIGTTGWQDLDDARFEVARIPGPPGPETGFLLTAEAGGAEVTLKADYEIMSVNSPTIDHAVAFLGGSADFNNVEINGDLLAVDNEGGVMDYNPVSGVWEQRTSGGDPVMDSNNNTINGDLATTSGNPIGGMNISGTQGSSGPVVNPTWNLDAYLVPNPDTIVLTDVSLVKNLNTDKTVVVVNEMGTSVEFKKCDIKGGVVMWAPQDWPQRGPARNQITWTQSKFGVSGGGAGTYRNIGVLAPASRLDSANAANPGYGLFYFHEMGHMNNATINGALWVVNEVEQWNNVTINYEGSLGSTDFEGMDAVMEYVNLIKVTEFHPILPTQT